MKNTTYMTGKILEVVDPVLYEITVDIPGIVTGVTAYPMRGELDEPRPGDIVLLKCLDPIYYSYFLYQKVKEDDFIGFRSNGKMIDVTPDAITIGIYDPEAEFNRDSPRPELTDWIKISSEGGIEMNFRKDTDLKISGNVNITIEGSSNISSGKDLNIESSGGNVTITSSSKININGDSDINIKSGGNITISKSGTLTLEGTSNTDLMGPFNGIPTCPFSGAPHCGSKVS